MRVLRDVWIKESAQAGRTNIIYYYKETAIVFLNDP
jgi:hypothetical protein